MQLFGALHYLACSCKNTGTEGQVGIGGWGVGELLGGNKVYINRQERTWHMKSNNQKINNKITKKNQIFLTYLILKEQEFPYICLFLLYINIWGGGVGGWGE